jgi:endo-alpha-1,4-polygalactosaminidase (GH114 family)
MRTPTHIWPAAAALLVATLLSMPAAVSAAPLVDPRLAEVHSWAFAIGNGSSETETVDALSRFDLVVLDGEDAPAALVSALHDHGVLVLGYLSVGTIEQERWWYPQVKQYRLGWWGDWGEWYADASKRTYRDVLVARVAPWMLDKGFDGLFLDNTDMIAEHRAQARGMRYLVRDIALTSHGRGRLVFAQNGAETIGPMLAYLDGWNLEDVTWTYDFESGRYTHRSRADIAEARRDLRAMRSRGILALATDYTSEGDARAEAECRRNAWRAAALSFTSDIWLTRLR